MADTWRASAISTTISTASASERNPVPEVRLTEFTLNDVHGLAVLIRSNGRSP
jgi:hypothetical protein